MNVFSIRKEFQNMFGFVYANVDVQRREIEILLIRVYYKNLAYKTNDIRRIIICTI